MLGGPNQRATDRRGTTQDHLDSLDRGIGNFARGLQQDSTEHPEGNALSLAHELEISPPGSLSLSHFYLKPVFKGEVRVQFGSSNPELEIIRQSGRFEVEMNRQVNELVVERTTAEITDQQLGIIGQAGRNMIQSPVSGVANTMRSVLATRIVRAYQIGQSEIEFIMPPELGFNRLRMSASIVFMKIIGSWTRKVYETTLWGVPARVLLTGEVAFKVGLRTLGWEMIGRILARHFGTWGAAAQMEIMTAQLGIRGFANGLLGIYSPGIVAFGTPVVTFLIDYAWANLIHDIRTRGERRGLLNQFATGYIRRVFYPNQPNLWHANHPQGRARSARGHGIQVAERDLRHRSADILQQLIYAELDTHGRHQAQVSDLIYRLGEALFRGQRSTLSPSETHA